MVKIETLNELSQLKSSGFGQPPPRHGLDLLYWFAHDYVKIDSYGRIVPNVSPETEAYGFHRFYNKIEDDEDALLPNQNHPYYEVGNLNASKADKLPNYVRENNTCRIDGSNKDRIIVRFAKDHFDRVYVTEHSDQWRFERSCTFRVSQGLIKIIKQLERKDFLKKVEYQAQVLAQARVQPKNDSWCTIL